MAFSSAIVDITVFGNKRIVKGTYNASGVTGGDIATGLSRVDKCHLQPGGASAYALAPSVNETFPLVNSTGGVTIVCNSGETGFFEAEGV